MAATTSPFEKFKEGLLYKGREGHWAFILHRVSGLAILLFLFIHVFDTSWVYFAPESYKEAIELYGSLPFLLSEYALFAAIVYHAINGLNVIIKDTFPTWWNKHIQPNSFWKIIALSVLCWLPAAYFVSQNIYLHHICTTCTSEPPVPVNAQGFVYLLVPVIVIVLLAVLAYGGTFNQHALSHAPRTISRPGKNFETWSWLFMRWSGGILIFLVWIHVLTNALLTGAHHIDVAYVEMRWAEPLNWGSTFTILMLALLHGVNGLRAVVGDYVHNPTAVRVINAVAFVAWLVVTVLGAIAMFMLNRA